MELSLHLPPRSAHALATPDSRLRAAFWFLYLVLYGELPLRWSSYIYHLFTNSLAPSAFFWLLLLVTPVACVLPGFFLRQAALCARLPPVCHQGPGGRGQGRPHRMNSAVSCVLGLPVLAAAAGRPCHLETSQPLPAPSCLARMAMAH